MKKYIPIKASDNASFIATMVRRIFMKNFENTCIVGMNVIVKSTGEKLGQLSTLPGSTDFAMDIAVHLSRASYCVTDKIRKLMDDSLAGDVCLRVVNHDSLKLGVIKYSKKFAQSNTLTYSDLQEYFTFFDDSTVLAHSLSDTELEFEFYVQDVRGLQDIIHNELNFSGIFGEDVVQIPMVACATTGLQVFPEEQEGQVNLCIQGADGDIRVSKVAEKLQGLCDGVTQLFATDLSLKNL